MAAISSTSRLPSVTPTGTAPRGRKTPAHIVMRALRKNRAYLDHLKKDREAIATLSGVTELFQEVSRVPKPSTTPSAPSFTSKLKSAIGNLFKKETSSPALSPAPQVKFIPSSRFKKALERASRNWVKDHVRSREILGGALATLESTKARDGERREILSQLQAARKDFQIKNEPNFTNIPVLPNIFPDDCTPEQIRMLFRHLARRTDIFSWDFKKGGCGHRATLVGECLRRAGVPSEFISKTYLCVPKEDFISPHPSVAWWEWHVAITVRIENTVLVLDPALNSERPLSLEEWRNLQQKPGSPTITGTPFPGSFSSIRSPSNQSFFVEISSDCYLFLGKDGSDRVCTVYPEFFKTIIDAINTLAEFRSLLDTQKIQEAFPLLVPSASS